MRLRVKADGARVDDAVARDNAAGAPQVSVLKRDEEHLALHKLCPQGLELLCANLRKEVRASVHAPNAVGVEQLGMGAEVSEAPARAPLGAAVPQPSP